MSNMKGVERLKVPLDEIKLATDNFSKVKLISRGGYGNVYSGKLYLSGQDRDVAVKRLDPRNGQGEREFLMEIQTLSLYRHKNLVSLLGFCDDNEEKILIYEYAKHGSVDRYVGGTELSWTQRLQICLGAARGISYLHNDLGPNHRVLHRDIKCSNILLNDNWEAQVSDFGLSKVGPSNVEYTFLVTGPCGTMGYVDPQYVRTGILTKESDVYSFGVVLFELLCGRLALIEQYQDERRSLASLAQLYFEQNKLSELIHADIKDEIKEDSLITFSAVAYQCLTYKQNERPRMDSIVKELEKALELQVSGRLARLIQLGTWGRPSEGPQDIWSFELAKDQKLQKMIIDHGDIIYSLMFTCASNGVMQDSNKLGGSAHGDTVSMVTFDDDEELVGINGTIGTLDGLEIISSLLLKTTKRNHGPFGRETENVFSVPWEQGSLDGFYGSAGHYINSIGVYVKPHDEIIKVGTWGRTFPPDPENHWSFQLERNHHLKTITIDHGSLIYSLSFTTEHRGLLHTSRVAGGWNGGDTISEVNLDWNEKICAINGTVGVGLTGENNTVVHVTISSISFVTNKRTHGLFGDPSGGTPFNLPWDKCSFAGFYGLCGYFLDSIGVLLRTA